MPNDWLRFTGTDDKPFLLHPGSGVTLRSIGDADGICRLNLPGMSYRDVKASFEDAALLLGAVTVPTP